jgi:hypothetical protein
LSVESFGEDEIQPLPVLIQWAQAPLPAVELQAR